MDEDASSNATVIVCLPSPNVTVEMPSIFPPTSSTQPAPLSTPSMSNSPSFCIDPDNKVQIINGERNPTGDCGSDQQSGYSYQLTANDVFARSTNFIKRPSTLMTDDAMNQVAQALESSSSLNRKSGSFKKSSQHQQQAQQQQARQNRRQAIVPPKLVTDAGSNSDSESNQRDEPPVGQLIDVDDENQEQNNQTAPSPSMKVKVYAQDDIDYQSIKDAQVPEYRVIGRKRSGGSGGTQQQHHQQQGCYQTGSGVNQNKEHRLSGGNLGGSQSLLPTFYIESDHQTSEACSSSNNTVAATNKATTLATGAANSPNAQSYGQQAGGFRDIMESQRSPQQQPRPDSQMTNADSIVSSGSSTNLSLKRESAASPGGLTVSFGNSTRRRSSIAVIPQMQICPGDLLVYSKQLIDRMNQPEETENQPPQFLTIDDKKGKNIWSSFKLVSVFFALESTFSH